MLDDDDLDFALLASPASWLGVIIIVIVAVLVFQNRKECSQMHCEHGTPKLAAHECLCVEVAKP
jgi:hypothetical protein